MYTVNPTVPSGVCVEGEREILSVKHHNILRRVHVVTSIEVYIWLGVLTRCLVVIMFIPSAIPFTLSIATMSSECPEEDDINSFICVYTIPDEDGTVEDVTNVGC